MLRFGCGRSKQMVAVVNERRWAVSSSVCCGLCTGQHIFCCMCALTDLQLSLDAVLAAVAVLGLRGVVLSHHFHKLA